MEHIIWLRAKRSGENCNGPLYLVRWTVVNKRDAILCPTLEYLTIPRCFSLQPHLWLLMNPNTIMHATTKKKLRSVANAKTLPSFSTQCLLRVGWTVGWLRYSLSERLPLRHRNVGSVETKRVRVEHVPGTQRVVQTWNLTLWGSGYIYTWIQWWMKSEESYIIARAQRQWASFTSVNDIGGTSLVKSF